MLTVQGIMDMQQLMCAALQQLIADIAESRVLLWDLEFAGFVRLEDGFHALTLARVRGGG